LGGRRTAGIVGGAEAVRPRDVPTADAADWDVIDHISTPPPVHPTMAIRRRTVHILLLLLGLFLLGTVLVLSSISYYLSIPDIAYISEEELSPTQNLPYQNSSQTQKPERIPRIIHQTWKSETLPEKWKPVSEGCRTLMPD